MNNLKMLGFDLGASNGRAILGEFDGAKLRITEKARFVNEPLHESGHWHWDISRLLEDVKKSMRDVAAREGVLDSMGIDSWGVDFGLLDASDRLLGNPYHYRDTRTDGMREIAFSRMPRHVLYQHTGNAFERYNTLFQVMATLAENGKGSYSARCLLLISDLFVFLLTGVKGTEFTAATTTQLLQAGSRLWCIPVLEAMAIPPDLLTPVTPPGLIRGTVTRSLAEAMATTQIPVVAVAHHDTASAVAAIPSVGKDHCFLSSGTWSLMGIENDAPILSTRAMELGYTNEGCADGGYRVLKNIMGLWILQECKRSWDAEGQSLGFGDLSELAKLEKPLVSFIDPGNDLFFEPGNMEERIRRFCKVTGQSIPTSRGALVRCILESLALKYRWALENLESVVGREIPRINIVGGGSKNRLLNQFTANATNRRVTAGPEEAAAIGNLIMQAIALGKIKDLREGKEVVRNSFPVKDFIPANVEEWDAAYGRFCRVCETCAL